MRAAQSLSVKSQRNSETRRLTRLALLCRTSLFLLYFYAGAFLTLVLAVHFGVSVPENPPSATMRGVFILVGAVVGGLAGSVAILIAGWARFGLTFIGGWSVAWWILSFGQGGLINALWGRWVLFAGASRPLATTYSNLPL